MDSSTFNNKDVLVKELLQTDKNIKVEAALENDDFQSESIHRSLLSYCYEFAYNEGLSHEKIDIFVRFYHRLIKDTAMQEIHLNEAAVLMRERTTDFVTSGVFRESFIISAIEFISITLLQHYHLIVFALCYSRQQDIHVQDILVEVAPYQVDSLKDGKRMDQWKLENALEKEEKRYADEDQALHNKMADIIETMEKELEEYFTSLSNLKDLNVDVIAEIIQNIVNKRGDITRAELEYAMDKSRALMSKNIALVTVQNEFKENLKNQQQAALKPASPPKRAATSSPSKKNKK